MERPDKVPDRMYCVSTNSVCSRTEYNLLELHGLVYVDIDMVD